MRAIDIYIICRTSFKKTTRSNISDIVIVSPRNPLKLVNFTRAGIITSRLYAQSFFSTKWIVSIQ